MEGKGGVQTGASVETGLDLRGREDATARQDIFYAARNLLPGQRLRLLLDHDPQGLMTAVAFQLRDTIAWAADRKGDHWEVLVTPRAEAKVTDVVDLLTRDHVRLDSQFASVLRDANMGRFERAAETFADYWLGLRRHVYLENLVLAPVLGGDPEAGPLADMLHEHDSLLEQGRVLAESFAEGDHALVAPICALLSGALAKHENREENTLFPLWTARCRGDAPLAAELLVRAQCCLAGAEDAQVMAALG